MAALPQNDRLSGPYIASAGQQDFAADFPLIKGQGLRARIERGGAMICLSGTQVEPINPGERGFTCRLAQPAQAGDRVWIFSLLPTERDRSHTPNGAVRTLTLEDDAEEQQAQHQEVRRDLNRALIAPLGELGLELPPRAVRAGRTRVVGSGPDGELRLLDGSQFKGDPGGTADLIGTLQAARQMTIGPEFEAVRTTGYSTPGDGGGALYRRVWSEPSHAGKFQSLDGQWWELAEAVLTPQMFGSPGNLVGDDAPGLTAAFTLGRPVFLPQPAVGYQLLTPCTATLKAELELDFGGHPITFKGGYIRLTGQTVVSDRTLASAAGRYATSVKLNSVAGLAAGDLLYIGTNVPAETGWNYTKKDLVKIRSIDPTTATVELDEPLNFAYATSDIGLTVSAARPQSVKLLRPNLKYDPALGNQAMIDLIDLQNVVVEEPSGSGAHAGFVPSSDESRRGIRLVRCWGGEVNKSVWDSLSYPIMVITGTRNVLVNGVSGRNCRHLVVPSDWPKTIIVRGLTGSDNFQSVESHPAFDVRYEAVSVERDASLSNLRCVGAMLRNANIHTLATNAEFGPYFHSLIAANATAEYLYSDADLVLDNVLIRSPNRTAPTVAVSAGRSFHATRLRCNDLMVADTVRRTVIGGGCDINGRSAPRRWRAAGGGATATGVGVRSSLEIAANPLLPAYLEDGAYHINPRETLVDQSGGFLRCYGPLVDGVTVDPAVLPIRIHDGAFVSTEHVSRVLGRLRLAAFLRHSNAGSFDIEVVEYHFMHTVAATSGLSFPTSPAWKTLPTGQANESLTIAASNPIQVGVSQVGVNGDSWLQFDLTVASGRTSPMLRVTYELELSTG